MQKLFVCRPMIWRYKDIAAYFDGVRLNRNDLLITNRFIVDGNLIDVRGAQIIYQEQFGTGEPTDRMLMCMLKSVSHPYGRVIGIGSGTVLDLAKQMCLEYVPPVNKAQIQALIQDQLPIKKHCPVWLVPTTCGTGSEVTNVAVLLLESLQIKVGLAYDAMYTENALLIPSLLRTLPYKPMILSAIDALIHACESYVSPKANTFTRACSASSLTALLEGFQKIAFDKNNANAVSKELLYAYTMAGIAFNNAGCGPVHAMGYPVGGKYHLPHGESFYEVFLLVFRYYDTLPGNQPLERLKQLIASCLAVKTEHLLDTMESLLQKVYERKPLKKFGVNPDALSVFTDELWQKQQRLLGNAIQPFDRNSIFAIYQSA